MFEELPAVLNKQLAAEVKMLLEVDLDKKETKKGGGLQDGTSPPTHSFRKQTNSTQSCTIARNNRGHLRVVVCRLIENAPKKCAEVLQHNLGPP